MKTKFIVLSLMAVGICTMSCRQDDESLTQEDVQSSLKQQDPEIESQARPGDSLAVENAETDPPRDGAHWKVDEVSGTKKIDSVAVGFQAEVDSGPKDPPKESSHWKGN